MAQPFAIRSVWDSRDVKANLARLSSKGWTFTTAIALTRTGMRIKGAERDEMSRVFDRPTPFTLNSVYLRPATPARLEAEVYFKDFAPKGTPAGKYLLPQVGGGERDLKRFELRLQHAGLLPAGRALVPASGAALDAYGNVSRGLIQKILSQLKAQADPLSNETARSRRRGAKQHGGRYFYGNPGHRGRGIWERFSFGFGSAVKPVFIEVRRRPTYTARFPFFDVGQRVANVAFGEEFTKAADERLKK
jgi:hypothetical protein